jgi:hypothetical protein
VTSSEIGQRWTGNHGLKVQSAREFFVETSGETETVLRRRIDFEFVFDLGPRKLAPKVTVPRIKRRRFLWIRKKIRTKTSTKSITRNIGFIIQSK